MRYNPSARLSLDEAEKILGELLVREITSDTSDVKVKL